MHRHFLRAILSSSPALSHVFLNVITPNAFPVDFPAVQPLRVPGEFFSFQSLPSVTVHHTTLASSTHKALILHSNPHDQTLHRNAHDVQATTKMQPMAITMVVGVVFGLMATVISAPTSPFDASDSTALVPSTPTFSAPAPVPKGGADDSTELFQYSEVRHISLSISPGTDDRHRPLRAFTTSSTAWLSLMMATLPLARTAWPAPMPAMAPSSTTAS